MISLIRQRKQDSMSASCRLSQIKKLNLSSKNLLTKLANRSYRISFSKPSQKTHSLELIQIFLKFQIKNQATAKVYLVVMVKAFQILSVHQIRKIQHLK
jgi:hypothetical protein